MGSTTEIVIASGVEVMPEGSVAVTARENVFGSTSVLLLGASPAPALVRVSRPLVSIWKYPTSFPAVISKAATRTSSVA